VTRSTGVPISSARPPHLPCSFETLMNRLRAPCATRAEEKYPLASLPGNGRSTWSLLRRCALSATGAGRDGHTRARLPSLPQPAPSRWPSSSGSSTTIQKSSSATTASSQTSSSSVPCSRGASLLAAKDDAPLTFPPSSSSLAGHARPSGSYEARRPLRFGRVDRSRL
jgi:hypothetical protein